MKVSIRAINLDVFGYDGNGEYFGPGPSVYRILVNDKNVGTIRAKNGSESWFSVLSRAKEEVKSGAFGSSYADRRRQLLANPKSHR